MKFLLNISLTSLDSFIVSKLKQLALFIDSLIYSMAEYTYKLFDLATGINFSNLTSSSIVLKELLGRIMSIVTVFMLFRIVVIFVQYLINPEKFKDSNIGGSKLITNVIISVSILALVYTGLLFGLINDIQTLVFSSKYTPHTYKVLTLPENTGGNLISRIFTANSESKNVMEINYGRAIGTEMLNSFLFISSGDNPEQWRSYTPDSKGDCDGLGNDNKKIFCKITYIENSKGFLELTGVKTNDSYLKYYPIISGIAGLYLIYIFFKFVSEILVRTIKLFVLELIAPIAIVTYIDPNNQDIFKKYWKTYFKIFAELFMKIIFINLAIVFINIGTSTIMGDLSSANPSIGGFTWVLLKVFFIFAVFQFIKILPELIKSIFGIEMETGKKGSFGSLVKGVIGGAAGLGVGAATGFSTGMSSGVGLKGAAFQGLTGGFQGAKSGATAKGLMDFAKKEYSTGKGISARSHGIREAGGVSNFVGAYKDKFTGATWKNQLKASEYQKDIESLNKRDANLDAFTQAHEAQYARENKMTSDNFVDTHGAVITTRMKEQELEELAKAGGRPSSILGPDGQPIRTQISAAEIASARNARIAAETEAKAEYKSKVNEDLEIKLADTTTMDDATRIAYEKLNRENPNDKIEVTRDATNGRYKNNVSNIKNDNANARAEIEAKKAEIKTREIPGKGK